MTFSPQVEEQLGALRDETLGGATLCLERALASHHAYATSPTGDLADLCAEIVATHPEMAPLHQLAARAATATDLPTALTEIETQLAAAPSIIAKRATHDLSQGDTILTFSSSNTVLAALLHAHNEKQISVIACESRPLCEGRLLAQRLGQHQVPVTLITDAAAAALLADCHAVWVGADAIGPDYFVNKTGTLGLALLAHRLEIPLYVLSDQLKFLPEDQSWSPSPDRPASELRPQPLPHVAVRNPTFEQIPTLLVADLITDQPLHI